MRTANLGSSIPTSFNAVVTADIPTNHAKAARIKVESTRSAWVIRVVQERVKVESFEHGILIQISKVKVEGSLHAGAIAIGIGAWSTINAVHTAKSVGHVLVWHL
jgi:hypothetical protein